MKPTAHMRWIETLVDEKVGAHGLLLRTKANVLQQFWEIAATESDITLPREIGPDGVEGRWRDVGVHRMTEQGRIEDRFTAPMTDAMAKWTNPPHSTYSPEKP